MNNVNKSMNCIWITSDLALRVRESAHTGSRIHQLGKVLELNFKETRDIMPQAISFCTNLNISFSFYCH